jgi:hypothetical protein
VKWVVFLFFVFFFVCTSHWSLLKLSKLVFMTFARHFIFIVFTCYRCLFRQSWIKLST